MIEAIAEQTNLLKLRAIEAAPTGASPWCPHRRDFS